MRRAVALLLLIGLVGCAPRATVAPPALSLEIKIAQTLNVIDRTCLDVLKSIQTAMPQSDDRKAIVTVIKSVLESTNAARKELEQVSKDPLATDKTVVALLSVPIRGIQAAVANGLVGIKNPDSKAKAEIWLIGISAAVSTIQGILEATNG